LLGWWVIYTYKKIHGQTHPKLVVLSSTVSSAILKSMAKIEGIIFEVNIFYSFDMNSFNRLFVQCTPGNSHWVQMDG